jgi:hypothetical protein
MPRKKTEPKKVKIQKQKQQQRQVVNVVVNQPVKRTRRRYVRRQVVEREPEISAKQLTPVIIQQPVLSQNIPPPPSYPFAEEPKREIKSPIDIFQDLKAQAEPLFTPKKDYLVETEFIVPVQQGEKLTNEGHGIFFQENLKDMALNDKKDNFQQASLANIDYVPPSYELSPERDIAALTNKAFMDITESFIGNEKEEKKKYKIRIPHKELVNDFKLYAKDESEVQGKTSEEIANFIKDTMENEKINAKEFRKKYMLTGQKAKERYKIMKFKESEYNKQYAEKEESVKMKTTNPLYEMVQSTTK